MKKHFKLKIVILFAGVLIITGISLIIIPGVLKNNRKNKFKDNLENVVSTIEDICDEEIEDEKKPTEEYIFSDEGVKPEIDIKGGKPTSGNVSVSKTCKVSFDNLSDGEFVGVKKDTEDEIKVIDKEPEEPKPFVNGTFLTPFTYVNWTETEWEAEFQRMKKLGIKYLVQGDMFEMDATDPTGNTIATYYPSNITSNPTTFHYDATTKILEMAKKYNMKVFLGMGMNSNWYRINHSRPNQEPEKWQEYFINFANRSLQYIEEYYNKYYNDYSSVIEGFYFVPEISNSIDFENDELRSIAVDSVAKIMNIYIDKINQLNSNLPMMLSPYLNLRESDTWTTKSSNHIKLFWEELIEESHLRNNDILCPQDGGSGGVQIERLDEISKAYTDAISDSGKKVKFWYNQETFYTEEIGYGGRPDGINYAGSMTIDDLLARRKIEDKYAEQVLWFTYTYYYAPTTVIDGFYNTIVDYIDKSILDKEKPSTANRYQTGITTLNNREYLEIRLGGMKDNYGIQRMNVYKNGSYFTYRIDFKKENLSLDISPYVFVDKEFNLSSDTANYEVEFIDCSGNVSNRYSFTVNSSDVPNGVSIPSEIYLNRNVVAPTDGTLYIDSNNMVAPIPNGFRVSSNSNEKLITDGLVIIDDFGNEFVYVPCNVNTYTYWFRYDDNHRTGTLPTDISNELDQIKKYGGFYISRYEMSFSYNNGKARAMSKKNALIDVNDWHDKRDGSHDNYLLNYVKAEDAIEYASNMARAYNYSSNIITSIPTGRQWDNMLLWFSLETNALNNASAYGNQVSNVLYAPGSNENWKIKNIYDVFGNLAEWVNELKGDEYLMQTTSYSNTNASPTFYWPLSGYYPVDLGFRTVMYLK